MFFFCEFERSVGGDFWDGESFIKLFSFLESGFRFFNYFEGGCFSVLEGVNVLRGDFGRGIFSVGFFSLGRTPGSFSKRLGGV